MIDATSRRPSVKRLFLQGFPIGVAIGLCLALSLAAMEYSILFVTQFSIQLIAVAFWLFVTAVVLLVALLFIDRTRSLAVRLLSAVAGMLIIAVAGVAPTSDYAHELALKDEIDVARPVIVALESFSGKHRRPPTALDELTPEFLLKTATASRHACYYYYSLDSASVQRPVWEPRREQQRPADSFQNWQFSIICRADWLFDLEVLSYRADGDYEEVGSAWKQRQLGDWMYYYFRD